MIGLLTGTLPVAASSGPCESRAVEIDLCSGGESAPPDKVPRQTLEVIQAQLNGRDLLPPFGMIRLLANSRADDIAQTSDASQQPDFLCGAARSAGLQWRKELIAQHMELALTLVGRRDRLWI